MRCPRCSTENPPDNKFCAECGAELVMACPSCGTTNPPSSKFCGECGTDLRGAEAPAVPDRSEQRLVSVLFADLVGFTPFSESRDSEEVRDMLTTYFDRSREIVEWFGGTVDKFIGDAVMAVWGATDSREDDAERAVRAGLELIDAVAALGAEIGVPELALRAGVMTGETSVGPGGNEKGLVVGDLVNTASRLQSIAEPMTLLVGDPTRNLAGGGVQFEALGEQTVKGKDEPVVAHRALRVVGERGGARRTDGLEPPFTGRDVELRLLKDQLHAAGSDGSARLVSVIGEAGIGKTRLSWELEKYIDGLAAIIYWHRGRSPAYGEGLTMWALGEMVRSRAGIAETDDAAKSRLKLRTAVAEYVTSEDDRRWLEPRLAALLGLEEAPSGDREELFAALRTFFHHIAARGTVVLVFEDMHWADPGLLDFVSDLVERSPRHSILVISLARPELLEANPGWGSGKHNFISLHLAPLGDTAMAELITGMVPGIPDEAVSAIVSRAGGIPLYAVEFVRMLLGSGELEPHDGGYRMTGDASDLALPDSLQAVIGARIDRLSATERELLQDAAVLGQSFAPEGLSIIRGETPAEVLQPLVDHQLLEIDDDPRSPEYGQYRFVQSVIREVAYGRLSKSDRYGRHLKVAEYFEGLGVPELMGAVASHYLSAYDAAPAGEGEGLLERGRNALYDAASRAAALQSHTAALSLYEQALELATSPSDQAAILEAAADSASWGGNPERAIDLGARAAAVYEELGDAEGRLRAIRVQGLAMNSFFRSGEALALLRPVYETIDEPTTVEEVALALETARSHMLNREDARAVEVAEQVLGRAEQLLSPAEVIDGIISKASSLGNLKRTHEATALLTGAVALADEHGLQAQALRAVNNLIVVASFDAPLQTREDMEEFRARALRFGAGSWVNRTTVDSYHVALDHGDLELAEQLLAEAESLDLTEVEREITDFTRARVAALRNPTADALANLDAAAVMWEGTTDPQLAGASSFLKAIAAFYRGDFASAFEHSQGDVTGDGIALVIVTGLLIGDDDAMERALAFVEQKGVEGRLTRLARVVVAAGRAASAGDMQTAADGFVDALEVAPRVLSPIDVAALRMAFWNLVRGDHPAARAAGEDALSWIRERGLRGLEAAWGERLPTEDVASETA